MNRFVYLSLITILATITFAYPLSQRTRNSLAVETTHAAPQYGSIGATPYVGSDYNVRPLVVIGVVTNKEKHAVEMVSLKNISNKIAVAVKIGWFVTLTPKSDDVFEEGETELIKLPKHLRPGDRSDLSRHFVGLVQVANELKQKGKFDSAYTLAFAATEIVFKDGTRWPDKKSATEAARARSDYSHASATVRYSGGLAVTPLPFCFGNQMQCNWIDSGEGGGGTYACEGAAEPRLICNACPTYCCNYFCDLPEPQCLCP